LGSRWDVEVPGFVCVETEFHCPGRAVFADELALGAAGLTAVAGSFQGDFGEALPLFARQEFSQVAVPRAARYKFNGKSDSWGKGWQGRSVHRSFSS
jgi:hypothetical protein